MEDLSNGMKRNSLECGSGSAFLYKRVVTKTDPYSTIILFFMFKTGPGLTQF